MRVFHVVLFAPTMASALSVSGPRLGPHRFAKAAPPKRVVVGRAPNKLIAATPTSSSAEDPSKNKPKDALLAAIEAFRAATRRDGVPGVDFGVEGGELSREKRAPNNLAASGRFYAVSDAVGAAADAVLAAVDAVAETPSLADDATRLFGTREGAACPLHGGWRNCFTTAADATFSKDSKRGDADVGNLVDATGGVITNVITFKKPDRTVDQLRVTIRATAATNTRLRLTFVKATLRFAKRFLGLFKEISIPVPAVTFTRILFFVQRVFALCFRKKPQRVAPDPPYFDVLYLDADLRVQRTGDGNVFVQRRIDPAVAGF